MAGVARRAFLCGPLAGRALDAGNDCAFGPCRAVGPESRPGVETAIRRATPRRSRGAWSAGKPAGSWNYSANLASGYSGSAWSAGKPAGSWNLTEIVVGRRTGRAAWKPELELERAHRAASRCGEVGRELELVGDLVGAQIVAWSAGKPAGRKCSMKRANWAGRFAAVCWEVGRHARGREAGS